jgi:hypothetical protein
MKIKTLNKVLIMTTNNRVDLLAMNNNSPALNDASLANVAAVQPMTAARTNPPALPKQDHRDEHSQNCLECMENDYKRLDAKRTSRRGVLDYEGSNSSMDLNQRLIQLHKEKDKASLEQNGLSRLLERKIRTKLQEFKKRVRDLEQEVVTKTTENGILKEELEKMKLRDVGIAEFMHEYLNRLEDVRPGEKRSRIDK